MECIRRCSVYVCIIVTIAIAGSKGQDLIGPDPEETPVLMGTTETLRCSRTQGGTPGTIAWYEDIPGETAALIYFGTGKESQAPKYDNFQVDSDAVDRFDLVISNFAIEDEGRYYCSLGATGESKYGIRTVEVPATSLELTQNGADVETVLVIAGTPSEIVCTASGARPAVTIEWYHRIGTEQETQITSGVSETNTDNGNGTSNTISTLTYDTISNYNGGQLRCVTTGQQVAESREDTATLNVQYVPMVTLQYGSDQVVCSSNANPEVEPSGYKIIVNDTDEYTPTCNEDGCILDLKVDFDTDVRCNATNSIGTGTKTIVAEPGAVSTTPKPTTPEKTSKGNGGNGSNIGAIIGGIIGGLLVIVIIVVLVYYLVVIKGKNKSKSGGGSEMTRVNGSGAEKSKDRPVPAPRNSTGNAHDNEEGKKVKPNDDPDNLVYAQVDHSKKPPTQNSGNDIIRTEPATEYADVKTFIV